jgi:orotate phosphoribosyltransferase
MILKGKIIMTYKESFIKFMVECGVLTFGDFTLKSGRKAPYFVNTGNYKTGAQLAKLGEFYAECINENNIDVETLFGPAYKGIPLAVSAAVALYNKFGKEVSYCFDRKEVKDHGEGGMFVGKKLADGEKVVIIEDVMTSGKALREVMPKLKDTANVNVTGMVITVDRMEKALDSELSAVEQAYKDFGVKVYSIVNINDIIDAIRNGVVQGKEYLDKMLEYRNTYGVNKD